MAIDPPQAFGELLRRHRAASGLTHEALAEQAGLSVRGLSDLERGVRRAPYGWTVERLAAALRLAPPERVALQIAARREVQRTAVNRLASRPMPCLPLPLTSFVGREKEVGEVRRLLGMTRLLTLTGAGGVGKTRLALEVAASLGDEYPQAVWLVELGAITDPALVLPVTAATLGVQEEAGRSLLVTLTDALRRERLVLLLDNCEHLVEACAGMVNDLLRVSAGLRVLATSRRSLGIGGERTWRVPSLSLPLEAGPAPVERVSASEAARLFAARAGEASPGFQLTTANASSVARVCFQLDGIPLAIELAAAWLNVLSVDQIAERLDDRLRLLLAASGSHTALLRRQTLGGTLDWSYGLLSDPERRVFNRLAVFASSWSLEAAEAVCAGEGIQSGEVLDLLARLVDQSMVQVERAADGRVRYRLLETLRQYATEKLEQSGESGAMRGRHRDWFLAQAERSPFDLMDPQHVAWLADELDNLRAALRWSIQHQEIEVGLRLARATGAFWYQRGFYAEGRAWLAELLALPGAEASPARAFALTWAARLAMMQGDGIAARAMNAAGLALARQLGDTSGIAGALLEEGVISSRLGNFERAQSAFEEGVRISRAHAHAALEFYHVSNWAALALEQGDEARAEVLGGEALALATRLGHVRGKAGALYVLGRVAAGRGDHAAARALLEKSLALYSKHSDRLGTGIAQRALGHLLVEQGEVGQAKIKFDESLTLAWEGGDRFELARSLEGLAGVWVEACPERAVRLAATATALREALDAVPYPWERELLHHWLDAARRKLGQELYSAAWNEGWAMPLAEAISLAFVDEACAQGGTAGLSQA
jgi:predicted ATPase